MKLKIFITSGFDLQECVDRAIFLYDEWKEGRMLAGYMTSTFQIDSRDKFTYMLSIHHYDIQT